MAGLTQTGRERKSFAWRGGGHILPLLSSQSCFARSVFVAAVDGGGGGSSSSSSSGNSLSGYTFVALLLVKSWVLAAKLQVVSAVNKIAARESRCKKIISIV